jgi:hypothetical protein
MSTNLDHAEPTTRQCGRCRKSFPSDPTLPLSVRLDWWLCPPCHDTLLGPQRPKK